LEGDTAAHPALIVQLDCVDGWGVSVPRLTWAGVVSARSTGVTARRL
jgi:hypothetical protein